MLCQTALHDVEAVVVAGLGVGQSAALGAVRHPHQAPYTGIRRWNLHHTKQCSC